MRFAGLAALSLGSFASPALAQDHSGHVASETVQSSCAHEAERHRAMGHAVPEDACAPATEASQDHSAMNHSEVNNSPDEVVRGIRLDIPPPPEAAPPASAGSGPPRAADAIWGAKAMRASRAALARENGGMVTGAFVADRFEYRGRAGQDGYLWDLDAWYGGDIDKLWLKSEGEGSIGEAIESADLQALWSHAIGPWFDLQAGLRQDLTGPERTYAVLGVQGLAPYLFHVDAAAFLSTKGDLTASVEAELNQRITQRLILQPRGEIALAAQDVPELGIGAGLDTIELGLRLRYEFVREFAPYLGVEQEWKLGGSADYARAVGEDASVTNFVVGVKFWF